MNTKEIKFLLTHSSIYGLGTMISRLISFLLLPLYTRYLNPEQYGVLETIDISNGIIGICVTVGIAMALSRFYYLSENEKERKRVVSTALITYLMISILVSPVLYFLSDPISKLLFDSYKYGYYFKISFAALIVGSVVDIGATYLRLLKKPAFYITLTITRLFLLISLNILFIVYFKLGILGILYSSLIVRSLYCLIMFVLFIFKVGFKYDYKLSKEIIKYGLPIIPSKLANMLVKQSDKYFVLAFISVADMGIYSIALKIGNAVHTIITIPFNLAYIPRRFEIVKKKEAKSIYSEVFTYYIFVMGFIGISLSLLIEDILKVMVTPEFYKAAEIIPLVVLSMIIFGAQYHFNFGILYSYKTSYLAKINFVCAIISLIGNYFLIRSFGIFGAVYSAIISLTTQAIFLYIISNKLYPIEFEFKRIALFGASSISYFIICNSINFKTLYINILFKITCTVIFPLLLYFTNIMSEKEKNGLKNFAKSIMMKINNKIDQDG